MKGLAAIILMVWLWIPALAQIDITETIFSKMDIQPQHQLWDGNYTMLMGFTSLLGDDIDIPGPTLIYTEGDSVELKLWNMSQGAPHTIHLHGLDVDQQNDGVPHLSFQVEHSETRSYFFKAPHPGTYIYHCHVVSTLHVQAGMYGMLIIKPASNQNLTWDGGYEFDSEHAWMTSEIDTNWHTDQLINHSYDTSGQTTLPDFNPQYFLINGRTENQLEGAGIEVNASVNETVLIRLANIGFYGNRYVFPSELNATIISSDGRPLPNEVISDTLDLAPGERYQVLLTLGTEFSGTIQTAFLNPNTLEVMNTQHIAVNVSGFFDVRESSAENIQIHPNPTQGLVSITGLKGTGNIEVIDINGRTVSTRPLSGSEQLDLSILKPGLYNLRIRSESAIATKRVLVH